MAVIEGAAGFKFWTGDYDVATDGGGVGTIPLRSNNGAIPANAIILGGLLEVTSALTSATGTAALTVEGAGDILAATGQAGLTLGRKSILPNFTGAQSVKTTTARSPSLVIATAAFTGGAFRLRLIWI